MVTVETCNANALPGCFKAVFVFGLLDSGIFTGVDADFCLRFVGTTGSSLISLNGGNSGSCGISMLRLFLDLKPEPSSKTGIKITPSATSKMAPINRCCKVLSKGFFNLINFELLTLKCEKLHCFGYCVKRTEDNYAVIISCGCQRLFTGAGNRWSCTEFNIRCQPFNCACHMFC